MQFHGEEIATYAIESGHGYFGVLDEQSEIVGRGVGAASFIKKARGASSLRGLSCFFESLDY